MMINTMRLTLGLLLLLITHASFSQAIPISREFIIDKDTLYKNVILDLSHGSFLIKENATLTIEGCTVNGTISPNNPLLINVIQGKLILKKNKFNIRSLNIPPKPINPSVYNVINISRGTLNIISNYFFINTPYTVSLLTTGVFYTTDFIFNYNRIYNFHGGILLRNSHHAIIYNNKFSHVSTSNIFLIECSKHLIKKNSLLFPGNNNVGDGIDIVDSKNIMINDNYIASGSCYSLVVLRGQNISIDHNKILNGITYAIYISPAIERINYFNIALSGLVGPSTMEDDYYANKSINITNNYLAQNRYGLSASNVDGLHVTNNFFIQRFANNNSRQFWTNNDNLLHSVINLDWDANYYKEAYTQDMDEDNKHASSLIDFPIRGGVVGLFAAKK